MERIEPAPFTSHGKFKPLLRQGHAPGHSLSSGLREVVTVSNTPFDAAIARGRDARAAKMTSAVRDREAAQDARAYDLREWNAMLEQKVLPAFEAAIQAVSRAGGESEVVYNGDAIGLQGSVVAALLVNPAPHGSLARPTTPMISLQYLGSTVLVRNSLVPGVAHEFPLEEVNASSFEGFVATFLRHVWETHGRLDP